MTPTQRSINRRPVRLAFGWSALMLGLLCVYLIPEIIFNAKLVSIAGGRQNSDSELHTVELFGRAISGIGVTLLLADWLIRGQGGMFRSLLALAFVTILVWPTVFFGQKWLVDTWLINPSSPEQRQQAVISQLLRASLADKTVAIEGIPPHKGDIATPAEMTFLTTFGALVYTDSHLIESIEAQRGIIARQFVRNQAHSQFDHYYRDYQELRNTIRQGYRDYLEANRRFELEMAGADKRVDPLWDKAEKHVRDAWGEYQNGTSRLHQESQRLANDMAPRLYQYFKRRNACRNDRCRENLNNRYRQNISNPRLGYVDPMHWLLEKEISTSESD